MAQPPMCVISARPLVIYSDSELVAKLSSCRHGNTRGRPFNPADHALGEYSM